MTNKEQLQQVIALLEEAKSFIEIAASESGIVRGHGFDSDLEAAISDLEAALGKAVHQFEWE